MAENERFDDSISKWLEETAPARLPERVLDATFERTRRSEQHLGWRAPWEDSDASIRACARRRRRP